MWNTSWPNWASTPDPRSRPGWRRPVQPRPGRTAPGHLAGDGPTFVIQHPCRRLRTSTAGMSGYDWIMVQTQAPSRTFHSYSDAGATLPTEMTSFVGRRQELTDLRQALSAY